MQEYQFISEKLSVKRRNRHQIVKNYITEPFRTGYKLKSVLLHEEIFVVISRELFFAKSKWGTL